MNKETECLHGGYRAKNGEPLALPIYQSTTYRYESTEHVGKLFDLVVGRQAVHFVQVGMLFYHVKGLCPD